MRLSGLEGMRVRYFIGRSCPKRGAELRAKSGRSRFMITRAFAIVIRFGAGGFRFHALLLSRIARVPTEFRQSGGDLKNPN